MIDVLFIMLLFGYFVGLGAGVIVTRAWYHEKKGGEMNEKEKSNLDRSSQ